MDIYEAVATRRSIRDFLPTAVDPAVLLRVLEAAERAPSGGNLQPWQIVAVSGPPLRELKDLVAHRVRELPEGEAKREYDIYPAPLHSPYRERRFQVGEDMYREIGVPRDDRASRLRWRERNFDFFGAPVALFCLVDRRLGPPQWSDLGMYLQTVMLLLRAEGLDSCAQEIWSLFPETIKTFVGADPGQTLFCGMAIGHANTGHAINRLRSTRAGIGQHVRFLGIETPLPQDGSGSEP